MADKKGYNQSHVDRMKFWKTHPLEWVIDFFGENIKVAQKNRGIDTGTASGLSTQQEDALRQWGKLIEAKLLLSIGKPLTKEQEILSGKIGMSIMSGMGTGKDFEACLITWHFMYCFSYPKILATANTGKQLNEVFWSELAKVRGMARKVDTKDPNCLNELQANFEMQSEIMFAKLQNKEERGKRWFCSAVTINTKATAEQQGEALAGRHEDHMLFVIDEASGIPEAVFKPIEKTLTGKLNLVFMIFNPTQNTGFAIRSHNEQRDKWVCLHWDSRYSENVTKASIRNLEMYGKDSPDYRIGVLGLPPLADSNALIPYEWIQRAIGREFDNENDPIMTASDVGGGGDKSVFCTRQGGVVVGFKTNNSKDTMAVADWVAESMDSDDAAVNFVDIIGLGRGVYDRLRQMNYNARPADSRNTADDPDRYYNKRAEIYWKLRKQFEEDLISIPPPEDDRNAADPTVRLIRELGAIKNELVGKKNKIGDKKEIRKAIGFSPDYADALMMTYFKSDALFKKMKDKKNGRKVEMKNVFLR
jgi:hypothetical protein